MSEFTDLRPDYTAKPLAVPLRIEACGMVLDFRLGDVVRLRKPHPCGSTDWTVVRLGADIGLRCLKCEHRVLLDRAVVERRVKQFVSRGEASADIHSHSNRTSS